MASRKKPSSERYNLTLNEVLRAAAAVFARKGYHKASIRDISRESGISLSGLYYYFRTKEELLFLIAQHAFDRVLTSAQEGLAQIQNPEERVRFLIRNHLDYFVRHLNETKVLAHEADSLSGSNYEAIQRKKRSYLALVESLLREVHPDSGSAVDYRLAALALFGMMNWIYTWYHPERDSNVEQLSRTISALFIGGLRNL